jgi:hypothetical protein
VRGGWQRGIGHPQATTKHNTPTAWQAAVWWSVWIYQAVVIANDNSSDSSGANCHEHLKAQFQNMHCGTMIIGAM